MKAKKRTETTKRSPQNIRAYHIDYILSGSPLPFLKPALFRKEKRAKKQRKPPFKSLLASLSLLYRFSQA